MCCDCGVELGFVTIVCTPTLLHLHRTTDNTRLVGMRTVPNGNASVVFHCNLSYLNQPINASNASAPSVDPPFHNFIRIYLRYDTLLKDQPVSQNHLSVGQNQDHLSRVATPEQEEEGDIFQSSLHLLHRPSTNLPPSFFPLNPTSHTYVLVPDELPYNGHPALMIR